MKIQFRAIVMNGDGEKLNVISKCQGDVGEMNLPVISAKTNSFNPLTDISFVQDKV